MPEHRHEEKLGKIDKDFFFGGLGLGGSFVLKCALSLMGDRPGRAIAGIKNRYGSGPRPAVMGNMADSQCHPLLGTTPGMSGRLFVSNNLENLP